jgi:hypothetical protein
MREFSLFSNEELLELASQHHLIDRYHHEERHVVLYLNGTRLTLSLPQSRVFLGGMLWGLRDVAVGCGAQ